MNIGLFLKRRFLKATKSFRQKEREQGNAINAAACAEIARAIKSVRVPAESGCEANKGCQSGKTDRIKDCTPQKLESIAHWRGETGSLFENLLEVGFIEQDGGDVVMHDFKSRNAKLCANWKNGAKGGRAKRKTADSGKKSKTQTEIGLTHEEPTGNPNRVWVNPLETQSEFGLTHEEPTGNPNQVWVNPQGTQTEFGLTRRRPHA